MAATSFLLSVRIQTTEVSAEAARSEAKALAEAGAGLALHDLVNARLQRGWQRRFPADGRARSCVLPGGRAEIVVEDEAGKVDLNAAGDGLLRALLTGAGLSGLDAARLVAAILDYRDADHVRRPDGAEADDYLEAGRTAGPKDAPFDATIELAQVLGMSTALLESLRRHVTVHSGLQGIDPAKSAPELLALLAAGAAGSASSQAPAAIGARSVRLPAELIAVSSGRVLRIRAQAVGERGAAFALETIVRLAPSRRQLYSVLSWQQTDAVPAEAMARGIDLGPC